MDMMTLLGLALALAMDAFAVALGCGLVLERLTARHLFRLGWHFGLFQALMPILGWMAGLTIQRWIEAYDHWIAFGLLAFIGSRMIIEAFGDETCRANRGDPTRGLSLLMLSTATSIDALAVGLSLAIVKISVWFPALIIGLVAGAMTIAGMLLGRRVASSWGKRVEITGGVILIGIGLKILLEHMTGG